MAVSESTPQGKVAKSFAELVTAGVIPDVPTMLSAKNKELWSEQGLVFTIKSIQIGSDQTGTYFSHTIEYNGETYSFRLNDDQTRHGTELALMEACNDGPVEGCTLLKLSEKQGNAYLVIGAAE